MYSSYSAAAFALRASKPPSRTHSCFPSHHYHHAHDSGGGGGGHHNEFITLMNPHLTSRFLLDGYFLRHSAHLLLLSASLRPPPPPRPPHCCHRRVAARCFCSGDGRRPVPGHTSVRLQGRECRCCGRGTGRSDLGVVCRRLEVCGCRCGGSGSGRSDLVASCGEQDGPSLVRRAVRQEVWEYEGGEWPHRRCSMECQGDWVEEDDEHGLAQWEVPCRRRWEEDDDRCTDCHGRKGAGSNYYDEDEYSGQQREREDVNERHGRFRDSYRRRLEQRDYRDDEDGLDLRRRRDRREGRERRDVELEDAVDMRRARARRYGEDDRKHEQRREIRDFDYEDVVDANRVGASRHTEDDRRFSRRTNRRDFEIAGDDGVNFRREGRLHRNDDQRYVTQHQMRTVDGEEGDVPLSGSHHWHDQEYDYDDHGIAEQRYHSRGSSHKSAKASDSHEDNSKRASSSRNKSDARRKDENSTSRVGWHDNVDRRTQLTSRGREQRYSSSVGRSNDEKDEYDHEDVRFVRVKDSKKGTQDVRVITEDDTSLASSSKTTSILKRHSNADQQVAARLDESTENSQEVMEISEVRGNNIAWDSRTQSYHQEDRGEQIENRSSFLRSSVKMADDNRRQINQHHELDQQVVTLTDSRNKSEKLTDIAIDSSRSVSRASHSERNYDEVNQKNIDDISTSVHNISHITRDKKRYVNQQVIHETDIDVQNVTHVDVSKIRASDISVNKSSQNQLEIRSDVNSTSNVNLIGRTRGHQEQVHPNSISACDGAIIRGSQSQLETGAYDDWVHLTSVTNTADRTKERQKQFELTKTHSYNASTSAINTTGSVKEQIDLSKIYASDTTVVSSLQGLDTRKDSQAHRTSAVNLIDRATESRNNSDLQMSLGSSIESNDQVRTKYFDSSQDSRERLRRLEEAEKLTQHDMDMNMRQTGTTRTSDDKKNTSLKMEINEEGSSNVSAGMEQRGTAMGSSEQRITSETAAGSSIPNGSSDRHSFKESLLESAARLEKSSTFHIGKFVDELQKGVSEVNTTLTKNEKSIMEGVKRSSSRAKMKGPSDEMWDVQSATSQETFKTADKEEGSSADGATNSASQTPQNETALARKVHKSLWAYVADIIRLGWIQRGESHDSNNKLVKKSSSANSQSTEGWVSSLEHDRDVSHKKTGSLTPKDQRLLKSHSGESESRVTSTLMEESLHTGTQGSQISEANKATQLVRSKGDFVTRSSKDDLHTSRDSAKQSDLGASFKGNNTGGFVEDGRLTLEDVTIGHLPEHEAVTSSRISNKGPTEVNTGVVFAKTSSMTINTEEAGGKYDTGDWRNDPSGAITPYHHPQTSETMLNEDISAAILESQELPTGGSTRFEEKIVIQEPPEVMRTEGKDAELKRGKFQRNKQVRKETFDEWEEAYQRDAEQRKTDELFMREALLEAQRAADIWEVPVGAVLVQKGEIIARGCNLVEDLRDSTAHAEIVCIREASNKLRTWRLADTTLYVTLEPCAMCAGAILQARVDTVVWGAPNKLLGADGSWVRLFPGDGQTSTLDSAYQSQTAQTSGPVHPFHPKIIVRRGVLSNECSEIMQQFFHLRRKKKQKPESPPHGHHPGRNHPTKFLTKMHNILGTIFCI